MRSETLITYADNADEYEDNADACAQSVVYVVYIRLYDFFQTHICTYI